MSVKEVETPVTLSAVVPVGGFPNGDSALKSWLLQKLPEGLEVILVLDSDEKSVLESVQALASTSYANSVSVRESRFRNPGSTREVGLKASTGKWVCFWDADDLPEVEIVFRNLHDLENQEVDILIGDYRNVDFQTKKETHHIKGRTDPIMNVYLDPGLWRCVFKRCVVQNISFPALKMGEDQVFLFRALNKSNNIKFVNENFYNYYQYSTGQLTKSNRISEDLISARSICREMYVNNQSPYLMVALMRQNLTIMRVTLLESLLAFNDLIRLSFDPPRNLKMLFRVLKVVLRGE